MHPREGREMKLNLLKNGFREGSTRIKSLTDKNKTKFLEFSIIANSNSLRDFDITAYFEGFKFNRRLVDYRCQCYLY